MEFHDVSLKLHVLAGGVALVTFWTAALLRKGSRPHRLAGRVYLLAMLAVVASGIPLILALALRGQWVLAAFLGFLVLLVGNACWSAWFAIRHRRDFRRYAGPGYRVLVALTAAGGLGMIVLGLLHAAWLLVVFGGVGLFAVGDSLRLLRRGPAGPNWWLREHYGAMIGNGVATHIAFFSIGLRHLLPGLDPTLMAYLPWLLPLGAALIAGFWLERRYRHGLAGSRGRRSLDLAGRP